MTGVQRGALIVGLVLAIAQLGYRPIRVYGHTVAQEPVQERRYLLWGREPAAVDCSGPNCVLLDRYELATDQFLVGLGGTGLLTVLGFLLGGIFKPLPHGDSDSGSRGTRTVSR